MERLTYKYDGCNCITGLSHVGGINQHGSYNYIGLQVDRLSAYEDTGLAPEEILSGLELANIAAALMKLKEYQKLETHLGNLFGGELSLQQLVDDLELALSEPGKDNPTKARILTYEDADRYDGYKAAEEEGLLVKLPCKVGDTVYVIWNSNKEAVIDSEVVEETVERFSIIEGGVKCIHTRVDYYRMLSWRDRSIESVGKTVFLTRAAAEAKLKELEGEQCS